jgi:hypothetical protein
MRTNTSPNALSPGYRSTASPLPDVIGLGGALAGLCGGLAMIIVGALLSAVFGGDMWLEAKQIAAPFYGSSVNTPGFDAGPVVLGTLLHFATAALLGSIYSIALRRVLRLPSDVGVPVLSGLIYGFLLWILAYFVVLPLINPSLRETYAPSFIIQHLVYGIVLGLVYAKLRPAPYADGAPRDGEF